MRHSSVVALHFSRLVSQLVAEPKNTAVHRSIVDEAVEAASVDAVEIRWEDWRLFADNDPIPDRMPGVRELLGRMAAHGLRAIVVRQGAEPAQILSAALVLAQEPKIGDGGAHAISRLAEFRVKQVAFVPVFGRSGSWMSVLTPSVEPPAVVPAQPSKVTPVLKLPHVADRAPRATTASINFDDMDLSEPVPRAPEPTRSSAPTPFLPPQPVAAPRPGSAAAHLVRLRDAITSFQRSNAFEPLLDLVQKARAAGRLGEAVQILADIMDIEAGLTSADAQRDYLFALRRVLDSGLVAQLASGLPMARDLKPHYMRLLDRFGEEAVEALLDALVRAQQARDRRILFDAIVELRRGVPTLIRMLDDERWYVVRNAAELLGRLGAREAEGRLQMVLGHPEPRVRRVVASTLGKLGTPTALAAVGRALDDPNADVRIQVVQALATRREPSVAAMVLRALDAEQDPEVQRAMYVALGKIGTPDAVRRLVDAAVGPRRLFWKSKTPVRVAAIRGLSEVNTPQAVEALRSLTSDREPEVRETAAKGLAELGQR